MNLSNNVQKLGQYSDSVVYIVRLIVPMKMCRTFLSNANFNLWISIFRHQDKLTKWKNMLVVLSIGLGIHYRRNNVIVR